VRGELQLKNWQRLSFAVAILILSIPETTVAAQTANQESITPEGQPQLELAPTEKPGVIPDTKPVNPTEEVRLTIRLRERRVYLYRGDRVQTSYPIAVGKKGWETPTGSFKVLHMERNPTWEHPLTGQVIPPGSNNPLGARWIGFWTDGKNFIGFHGTPNERLVGQAVSHGCIRMRNRDIEALYELVTVGTSVTVVP
jgi:L,D-transpeptidase ErfK/SrfK